jgi:hypothetical protein
MIFVTYDLFKAVLRSRCRDHDLEDPDEAVRDRVVYCNEETILKKRRGCRRPILKQDCGVVREK